MALLRLAGEAAYVVARGAETPALRVRRRWRVECADRDRGRMCSRAPASTRQATTMVADHNSFANLPWQIADLLRGPYPRRSTGA